MPTLPDFEEGLTLSDLRKRGGHTETISEGSVLCQALRDLCSAEQPNFMELSWAQTPVPKRQKIHSTVRLQ